MNEARRPIKTREITFIQILAQKITKTGVTPDQISLLSIVFAILAAFSFGFLSYWQNSLFALLAALAIQGRLLCNLFDGMVAVEGQKESSVGILFNEIPDRITDTLILISVGYALNTLTGGVMLGWLGACLALFTAYIRVLSTSVGAPTPFMGPMSKSHRMAALTLACLFIPIEHYIFHTIEYSLFIALILINVGAVITLIRRTAATVHFLNKKGMMHD